MYKNNHIDQVNKGWKICGHRSLIELGPYKYTVPFSFRNGFYEMWSKEISLSESMERALGRKKTGPRMQVAFTLLKLPKVTNLTCLV